MCTTAVLKCVGVFFCWFAVDRCGCLLFSGKIGIDVYEYFFKLSVRSRCNVSLCVSACVHMYACVYVYVCMNVYVCICMYVCMYVCMCVRACVCVCVDVSSCMFLETRRIIGSCTQGPVGHAYFFKQHYISSNRLLPYLRNIRIAIWYDSLGLCHPHSITQ